jgi:hypothetical protein
MGHRRVPAPPARMTGWILSFVSAAAGVSGVVVNVVSRAVMTGKLLGLDRVLQFLARSKWLINQKTEK